VCHDRCDGGGKVMREGQEFGAGSGIVTSVMALAPAGRLFKGDPLRDRSHLICADSFKRSAVLYNVLYSLKGTIYS
jgi:hypothetical protein